MWQSLPLSSCWDCEQNLYCSHLRRGLAEPVATSIQDESMTHISGQCRAGETVRMTARRGCAQPCHHSSQLSASTSCPSSYLLTSTPSLQAPTEQSARTPLHEEWASRTPGRVSMLSPSASCSWEHTCPHLEDHTSMESSKSHGIKGCS